MATLDAFGLYFFCKPWHVLFFSNGISLFLVPVILVGT